MKQLSKSSCLKPASTKFYEQCEQWLQEIQMTTGGCTDKCNTSFDKIDCETGTPTVPMIDHHRKGSVTHTMNSMWS